MYVRNPGSLEGRPALDSGGPFPPPCGIPAGLSFATGPYSGFGRVFVGQLVTKTDLAGLWRGCGHRTEKGGDPGRNRGKPPGPPRASAPYLAAGCVSSSTPRIPPTTPTGGGRVRFLGSRRSCTLAFPSFPSPNARFNAQKKRFDLRDRDPRWTTRREAWPVRQRAAAPQQRRACSTLLAWTAICQARRCHESPFGKWKLSTYRRLPPFSARMLNGWADTRRGHRELGET